MTSSTSTAEAFAANTQHNTEHHTKEKQGTQQNSYLERGRRDREAGVRGSFEVPGVRAQGAEGEKRPARLVQREAHHRPAWVTGAPHTGKQGGG